ncbi:MAG: choice-of-anchor D domain-containing protein [Myxococcota bacterium]
MSTPGKGDAAPDEGFPVADGEGDQGPLDTSNNEPPGPVEIALEPESPTTLDGLEVTIVTEAIDPDGGPEDLTYRVRWTRDGQETSHTSMTIPPAVTSRGETWRVEVRAFDGAEEGPAAEAEVEIVNSPPSLAGVSLTPALPKTSDVLVCEAGERSDPDDDDVSVEYAWFVDDEEVEGATTGAMQPPLEAGARYACRVTPFDGALEGEPAWSDEVVPEAEQQGGEDDALISFQPKSLDMGVVMPEETSHREADIHNFGTEDLEITGHSFSGGPWFDVDMDAPLVVAPGENATIEVSFATDEPGLKKGTLHLESNAANPSAAGLPLLGVGASPCLQIKPSSVDFGGSYTTQQHKETLEIVSCGELPVTIDSVGLAAPSDTPFSLDLSFGPGQLPWTLQPGETAMIAVKFEPTEASETTEDDDPIPEEATVSFQTGGAASLVKVPVTGWASDLGCPMPDIHVAEGTSVKPGTLLHLTGKDSFSPSGEPSSFAWGVDAPAGADDEEILPTADDRDISYQTSVPGEYVFQLKVWDQDPDNPGDLLEGCVTATQVVKVKDATPLIVELTWDTPGDPDQTDEGAGMGADLDLHMHNGSGSGPDYDGDGTPDTWFDHPGDLFWFDKTPDWGEPGEANDPVMVREDADGKGPERIEYAVPVSGQTYTLGVHCWSGYDFGSSVATVRVWYFEDLVAEIGDVVLESGDFWEVGVIHWPHGSEIVRSYGAEGGPKITPDYPNPFFQ